MRALRAKKYPSSPLLQRTRGNSRCHLCSPAKPGPLATTASPEGWRSPGLWYRCPSAGFYLACAVRSGAPGSIHLSRSHRDFTVPGSLKARQTGNSSRSTRLYEVVGIYVRSGGGACQGVPTRRIKLSRLDCGVIERHSRRPKESPEFVIIGFIASIRVSTASSLSAKEPETPIFSTSTPVNSETRSI